MAEAFVGEIRAFSFDYAPRGWAQCNGQLLPISQNTALFSILGTFYGGNGVSNFALPDLRGRVAIHPNQDGGRRFVDLGESGGAESVTLIPDEIPAHTHRMTARPAASQTADPTGATFANGSWVQGAKFGNVQQYAPSNGTAMSPATLAATGGG